MKTSSSSSSVWHREDVESAASLKGVFVRFCVHHKKDIGCLCLSFGVSFRRSVTTFGEASPLWQFSRVNLVFGKKLNLLK